MSVAFDAVSTANAASVTSLSWTHTPTGTPSAIGIGCYGYAAAISSGTYGGTSVGTPVESIAGGPDYAGLCGLANPASGAQTVVLNFAGSCYPDAGAITVTGSDTTTCFSNHASAAANSANQTVTVTSATGELVMDAGGQDLDSGAPTAAGGQTQRWSVVLLGERSVGSTAAGAASVAMAWTWPGAANWATTAGSFKAAGSGTQGLTPGLVTNSNTFYAATVAAGAVGLTPSLFTNSNTFYAPTVALGGTTQSITPSLFTNSNTFYSPTVAPGAVGLTPSLFSNNNTFYAPTVAFPTQALTPSLFSNSNTFYAPTVAPGAIALTPGLFSNSNAFYSPTVAGGAIVGSRVVSVVVIT